MRLLDRARDTRYTFVIGASLSEPHIDGTCVHLRYMYVGGGGGGGSTYVPPFTIADYKCIPYTFGTTCTRLCTYTSECGTRLYTLGVRVHRCSRDIY